MKTKKKMKNYSNFLEKDVIWFSDKFKTLVGKYLHNLQQKYKKIVFYSLFPGGKRIRPLLMFACGKMLGVKKTSLFYPAAAVELVHNYSLIHDDLPCMDNAEYRRNKLTVHKKFGEANAVLVGDALLTLAFEVLSDWKEQSAIKVKVINLISKISGFNGLVKGQLMDIESCSLRKYTKNSKRFLEQLVTNKTSKLIQICFVIPAIVGRLDKNKTKLLSKIGLNFGLLFQITDDIIDYCSGEDKQNLTYPKLYDVESLKKIVYKLKTETIELLDKNFGSQSLYLKFLLEKIVNRTQ
jgi:geranylgeranyl pyrophosphate synthase